MTIEVDTVSDKDQVLRTSQGGISWALWNTLDFNSAPNESGSGLSTDGAGALTIPSTANSGLVMLRISDTDMGLYDFT